MKGLGQLQFLRRNYCILKRERECACDIIEKELKALNIIRKKKVDITCFNVYHSAEHFNKYHEIPITQKEYDLLKEVLYEKEN